MNLHEHFDAAFNACPLVAILRGVHPDEVVAVAGVLFDRGFRLIEVPLNSPSPFDSIAHLVKAFRGRAMIGAGTVTAQAEVEELARIGAEMVISPHTNLDVVNATIKAGLISLPGVLSPSEAFSALAAGAHALKLFPMEIIGANGVKALTAVLPKGTRLIGVGGISADNIPAFRAAGCAGFGLGSTLYKPGMSLEQIDASAQRIMDGWRKNASV
jgi:2-dehydro-3-deoxyphosphogalactonate aldolase